MALVRLYPCVPESYHALHAERSHGHLPASQHLLDDALAEHRAETRRQIESVLADGQHLAQMESGWRLSLSEGELNWLLEVLNDIRLGNWIALGSPEGQPRIIDEKTARQALHMEVAGIFQMRFLESLR
jgi:hypothetical protein